MSRDAVDTSEDSTAITEAKELGEWVRREALALGFHDAACVRVDGESPHAARYQNAIDEGRLAPLGYMTTSAAERSDVRVRMPQAQTMVVVFLSYHCGSHEDHAPSGGLEGRAKVSRYAWGGDYHGYMRKKLRKLRTRLLERANAPPTEVSLFNDTDPVLERAWAEATGRGFIGKSAMFIHRKMGTYTFLGGMITTLDLGAPPPAPMHDLCGRCTRCIDACPTDAFAAPFSVDATKCLTTWNVECPEDDRGDAPEFEGHGWAVGCDVCQEVCPWNKFSLAETVERFHPREGHVAFHLDEIPEDLAGTALARPKAHGLKRSVARALRPRSDRLGRKE